MELSGREKARFGRCRSIARGHVVSVQKTTHSDDSVARSLTHSLTHHLSIRSSAVDFGYSGDFSISWTIGDKVSGWLHELPEQKPPLPATAEMFFITSAEAAHRPNMNLTLNNIPLWCCEQFLRGPAGWLAGRLLGCLDVGECQFGGHSHLRCGCCAFL